MPQPIKKSTHQMMEDIVELQKTLKTKVNNLDDKVDAQNLVIIELNNKIDQLLLPKVPPL